jgi:hypothetical protein
MARIRDQLPCRVYLPPAEVVALCHDKYALSQALQANGVPAQLSPSAVTRTSLTPSGGSIIAHCGTYASWFRLERRDQGQDAEQAWAGSLLDRCGVSRSRFTLSEYLPGGDFNVRGFGRTARPC